MNFVLNKPTVFLDSDGVFHETHTEIQCKVVLDTEKGEATFYEQKDGEFVVTSVQDRCCHADGTVSSFTSETECVDFYKRSNMHVEA